MGFTRLIEGFIYMDNLLNIVIFLVMLGVLVTIHELGHFIAAKVFKVYVFEFSIGFGPKLFRKKKGETFYALRALPLGGYVAMMGEADTIPDEFKDVEIDPSRSLVKINRGKRAVVMAAGIVMNLVLGYMIFLLSNGLFVQSTLTYSGIEGYAPVENTVYSRIQFSEDSVNPLVSQGVESDDLIAITRQKVGDYEIFYLGIGTLSREENAPEYYVSFAPESFNDLSFKGSSIRLLPVTVTTITENAYFTNFEEDDELIFETTFVRVSDDGGERVVSEVPGPIVITMASVYKDETKPLEGFTLQSLDFSFFKITFRYNFSQAIQASNGNFVDSITAVAKGLQSLFTSGLENVSGPIGIFNMSASVLENYGITTFLYLWGLISVNLALFNLLPFPPLDGWHLLVVTVEAISRRELHPKFKEVASLIGFGLIILLSVAIIFKDVFTLFARVLF